ncbi:MAG: TonB-dependent receptor [Pseudomonadota bacterium]
MRVRRLSWPTIFLSLAAAFTAFPASAELDEIIVTARQQQRDVQDAPIAVSARSGADFDIANVSRLDNFNGFVPSLVVAKNDGAGRVVAIRGIGWETAQNIASQPSVLAYVDGIYLANPLAMGLDIGDIERVEVLRGPQGTEFGQGTTGGAINIITKKPDFESLSANASLTLGSHDLLRARGSINLPLNDSVALRASIQTLDQSGFAEISGGALDGYELDDTDSTTAKLALAIRPREDLSIVVSGFVHRSDQHAAAQKSLDDPNRDARRLSQDYAGIFDLDNVSASLTVQWSIDDRWSVTAKSGWQTLEKNQSVDGDRLTESTANIDIFGFGQPSNWDVLPFWRNDSDAFSQEVALSFANDGIDWVIGAYYLDHDNFNDFLEAAGPAPFSDFADAVNNPSPDTLPPFNSVLRFNEFRTVSRQDIAVYSQASIGFGEQFTVTGGLRWQQEDQRDFGAQFFGVFGGFDETANDGAVTWKLGADYAVSPDRLLYALISTGWKNGGSNPGAITNGAIFLGTRFAPEEVTTYEIGSRNLMADGRMRLNLTAFYNDHEHLQYIFEDPVPFGGGTGTVPESHEYGIEVEYQWAIDNRWQIDGMLAWQRGSLDSDVPALDIVDFRNALAPGIGLFTPDGFDTRLALATTNSLRGNDVPKLPDLLSRVTLTHSQDMSHGTLMTRLEWLYRGDMQARVFNNSSVDRVPAYHVVNAHMNYEFSNQPMSIAISATNLLDTDGVNNTFTNPFGLWTTSREYIPPRQVLATLSYAWD